MRSTAGRALKDFALRRKDGPDFGNHRMELLLFSQMMIGGMRSTAGRALKVLPCAGRRGWWWQLCGQRWLPFQRTIGVMGSTAGRALKGVMSRRKGGLVVAVVRGNGNDAAYSRLRAGYDSGDPELLKLFDDLAAKHLRVYAGMTSHAAGLTCTVCPTDAHSACQWRGFVNPGTLSG